MADAMARAHETADEDDDFYDIPAVSDRRAEAQHADQLARRLNSLASALNARSAAGNWLGVVALHDEAILAASEAQASHPETAGEINHVLGNAYYALGQYGVAIELHRAHAKIAQSACDRVGFATAYSNLGSAHHMLGQFDSAIAVVEQYRALAKELRDRRGVGAALAMLGVCHRDKGNPRKAIRLLEEAIAISTELGDRTEKARATGNLADCYAMLGQYVRAVELYKELDVLSGQVGDHEGQERAQKNIAILEQDGFAGTPSSTTHCGGLCACFCPSQTAERDGEYDDLPSQEMMRTGDVELNMPSSVAATRNDARSRDLWSEGIVGERRGAGLC